MKPIPLLVATALAAALILTPLVASAAGSITFSSPASGSSFKGSQSYTITGTVSPAPGQPDSAFISVKTGSTTVDAASVTVNPSTGAFTYSTAVGGSGAWVTGTYTISATDSFGATGSTTFTYTAVTTGSTAGLALIVSAVAPSLVYAGQTAGISALVTWNNGTATTGATFTVWLVNPSGTATALSGAPATPVSGDYWWNYPVPSGAANGLYAVIIGATSGSYKAWGQTSFTVNSQVASGAFVATLQKDLGANFSALTTAVGSVNTAVGGLTTTLGNMQTTLGTINTNVNSLAGLSGQLTSAASSIGTTQTYVLVVAVLAAITLVLELAILVRKLS